MKPERAVATAPIAPLARGQIAACARIVSGLPLFGEVYGYGAAEAARDLARAADGDGAVLVAAERERVLGFAWFLPRGAFGRSGYLKLLAIDAASQRRGIGSRLVRALEERWLAPNGIALLVSSRNPAARAFYERLGYAYVGTLASYVRPGVDEHLHYKRGPAIETGPDQGADVVSR